MSDAAGTGWLDVGRRDWSDEMLAATGLNRSQMPRLVEGSAPSGNLTPAAAEQLHLPRVVVAGGAGDQAAGAAGMGVIAPSQAFLSLGTSGVLFVVTDGFRPNPDKAAHAFCHCLPGRWHQMSVMLSAASALDWLGRLTGESDLQSLVTAAQARGLRRSTPYFLPYLSGERTPYNDPNARGAFVGLDSQTLSADLALAVLEGVALAFADGMDVLLESGGAVGEINVTGGGARFIYWGQLLAAALNRSLTYRVGSEIGAAMGAARLARLACTGETPEAVCVMPPIVHVIQPDPVLVALLADRRRIFVQLYRDLKDTFGEIAA
jgi:xylulokinase